MKKTFFTLFNVICIYLFSYGQFHENLKIGGYKYAYELKLNSPSIEYKFIIKERAKSEIIATGGNNYKVSTEDHSISVVDINKNVWGIYDGKSFYINTINYTGNHYLAKGEVIGKFIYFIGAPPFNEKLKKELGYNKDSSVPMMAILGGVVGAAIASSLETSYNLSNPVSYLLDIQTDKAICISKDLLYQKIAQYPDLKAEYFSDTIYDSGEKIRKYIRRLSDKHPEITLTDKDIKEQEENKLINQITTLKENLFKVDINISYEKYYQNIIELASHPDIEDIKLVTEKYSDGVIKSIGLEAKHYIQLKEDYSNHNKFFRIGTWRYFYNNGQLKMLVDYDLRERKNGRLIKFDKDGNIKKQEAYKLDWKIK